MLLGHWLTRLMSSKITILTFKNERRAYQILITCVLAKHQLVIDFVHLFKDGPLNERGEWNQWKLTQLV